MVRKQRDSGIELLRILAMIGVVILHYNGGRAFIYAQGTDNYYVLLFLESLCACAVDVFVLISGFFLSKTQKRSNLKPLELFVQVILLKFVFYIFSIIIGERNFSLSGLIYSLIPNSYFVMLYSTLYIISPYLNRVFSAFNKQQWKKFIVIIILLFSIIPTFSDVWEEIVGTEWVGISTITYKGSLQGFNIVHFMLMYFIGAYLRFNELPKMFKSRSKQIVLLITTILIVFVWALATEKVNLFEMRSAWVYHNTLLIFISVLLFSIFRSFNFKSSIINEFAGASFTCFLLHGYLLDYMNIEKYAVGNIVLMIGHILLVFICCYLISYIVYKIYNFATRGFFNMLSNKVDFFQLKDNF